MKLKDIKPNPNNPRTITTEKFDELKQSIKDFPEMLRLRPMVTDNDGVVLGGNMRLKALAELGFDEIPDGWVLKADDLTDEQKKEFIIKDNVPFGAWDWDVLANEWDEDKLIEWGMDVSGWDKLEPEATEDGFEVPDEIETDIVVGDLFQIGEHRLMCGDNKNPVQVTVLIEGESTNIITDPPYGINANKQTLGTGKKDFHRGEAWDNQKIDIKPISRHDGEIIIWGGNYYSDELPITNDWLCWDKKKPGLSFSEFELAWCNLGKNTRMFSHHWGGEEKKHPTMKPVAVMGWCINLLSNKKTIYDPFIGSGSIMVAAHQLNRKCYGMELDPKYCQVVIDRMKQLDPGIEIKKL